MGVVVRRVLKLAVAIVALVIVLVATGYINLSLDQTGKETIYHAFSAATPSVVSTASQVATLLPISSAAFLIGIALGLWRG